MKRTLPSILKVLYRYSKGTIQKKTGIPASVIKRFYTGKVKLSDKSVDKIFNFHKIAVKELSRDKRKERYRNARDIGLSSKEASAVRSLSESRADNYIRLRSVGTLPEYALKQALLPDHIVHSYQLRMLEVGKKLAKKHNVKLEYIFKGMAKNNYRTVDDWEQYTKEKVHFKKYD